MPESPISAMLPASRFRTDGSNTAITGINKSPISAVKTTSTATSVSLKKRSTRYLSRCVEMAHKTGPENAKTSQLMKSCMECYLPTICLPHHWPGDALRASYSPTMAAAMRAFSRFIGPQHEQHQVDTNHAGPFRHLRDQSSGAQAISGRRILSRVVSRPALRSRRPRGVHGDLFSADAGRALALASGRCGRGLALLRGGTADARDCRARWGADHA